MIMLARTEPKFCPCTLVGTVGGSGADECVGRPRWRKSTSKNRGNHELCRIPTQMWAMSCICWLPAKEGLRQSLASLALHRNVKNEKLTSRVPFVLMPAVCSSAALEGNTASVARRSADLCCFELEKRCDGLETVIVNWNIREKNRIFFFTR